MKANGADTVRVSWTGANADSCALDGAGAAKSGSKTFGPYSYSDAGSQSATVSCTNRLGAKSATAAWTVEALPPAVSATLSRTAVTAGTDRVDLSWSSNNSDSCAYDNRSRATSGNRRNPTYAGASVSFDRVVRGIQPADSLLKSAINAVAASQLVIGGDRYKRMVVNGAPGAGGGRPEQVSTILKKIACHESFASQFYAGEGVAATPRIGGPRIAGMPVYGGGGDVGIMQICNGRKPRHVWNWVENVKRGAFLLRDPVENLAYNYLLDQAKIAIR